VSEQSISWRKRELLESCKAGLAAGGAPGSNARERQLAAENEELKAALVEAHVESRVWRKGAGIAWELRGARVDSARGRDDDRPVYTAVLGRLSAAPGAGGSASVLAGRR
jgi:hypothetical protein